MFQKPDIWGTPTLHGSLMGDTEELDACGVQFDGCDGQVVPDPCQPPPDPDDPEECGEGKDIGVGVAAGAITVGLGAAGKWAVKGIAAKIMFPVIFDGGYHSSPRHSETLCLQRKWHT